MIIYLVEEIMKIMLKLRKNKINSIISVIISMLMGISFAFAESRIIVEGSSSIIIESQSNDTKLMVKNIETIRGGKFTDNNYNVNKGEEKFENIEAITESFIIEKAYPNPFNPTTNIKYGIDKISDIEIAIFDLSGRIVNKFNINAQLPGWHEFTWNGTNARDQQVSTGIYLVMMKAGNIIQKQKVTYLK